MHGDEGFLQGTRLASSVDFGTRQFGEVERRRQVVLLPRVLLLLLLLDVLLLLQTGLDAFDLAQPFQPVGRVRVVGLGLQNQRRQLLVHKAASVREVSPSPQVAKENPKKIWFNKT